MPLECRTSGPRGVTKFQLLLVLLPCALSPVLHFLTDTIAEGASRGFRNKRNRTHPAKKRVHFMALFKSEVFRPGQFYTDIT